MNAISIKSLVFASSNAGKCLEVKRYAAPLGIEVIGLADIASGIEGPVPEVKEVGVCYEENAALKARVYAEWSGRACVADDTGIEIDALRGLPGLHTARWGIGRVAAELGVDFKGAAAFVCCMAYAVWRVLRGVYAVWPAYVVHRVYVLEPVEPPLTQR